MDCHEKLMTYAFYLSNGTVRVISDFNMNYEIPIERYLGSHVAVWSISV